MNLTTLGTIASVITGFSVLLAMLFGLLQRFTRFSEDWYGTQDGEHRSVMQRLAALEEIAKQNRSMLQTHLEHEVPAMSARGEKLITEYDARLARLEERYRPPP